ncbi:NAD(P)-dependent dehydrogenase (short-subunit alcohol dehydrogenase family) [Paraburkholderia sp. JPY465]|uniref:SDR family NAD(P)-dependent oxidoreductase n=1 Tax=Paraburkholderia sp. JPY465 TaxID=3042285 RepID=UPI003D1E28CF
MGISYDFSGQVALVTGAASGMGLTTATAFAHSGARVVLSDVNAETLQAATEQLKAAGHEAIGIACDVSDETQVKSMIQQTVATFGRLDATFNNAGIQSPAVDVPDVPNEVYDRIEAINLRGVWNCLKYQLAQMRDQGSGAIVNCSSMGGLVGLPGRAAYHAAKHGVLGMTKSAALEFASRGIRVNAVCPGIIETPMVSAMLQGESALMNEMMREVPINRLGRPQEIAEAVLWLCSPGSTFVIGHALVVDGGYTIR